MLVDDNDVTELDNDGLAGDNDVTVLNNYITELGNDVVVDDNDVLAAVPVLGPHS